MSAAETKKGKVDVSSPSESRQASNLGYTGAHGVKIGCGSEVGGDFWNQSVIRVRKVGTFKFGVRVGIQGEAGGKTRDEV